MEIHFHGPLLARNESPDAAQSVDNREERDAEPDDGDGGRPSALPAVVALVVLVVFGYAVRRLRARDDDHQATLDEPTA